MTARAELFASLCFSQGTNWGDEEKAQLTTPIISEVEPTKTPVETTCVLCVQPIGEQEDVLMYARAVPKGESTVVHARCAVSDLKRQITVFSRVGGMRGHRGAR